MQREQPDRALTALKSYFDTSLDDRLSVDRICQAPATAITLFHRVAETVPAYRDFLAEHRVDPTSIRSIDDFRQLPPLTKEDYIQRYPLADLCHDGKVESCDMIAVSSGSTGTPTFWPRFVSDEVGTAFRFEQVFCDSFRANERRTLAVICFALGTWVGGMFTARCCRLLASKGYPITVISPGSNKDEIFRVIEALGDQFDQTVLLGYPPFLKDVIDTGLARGLDWERFSVKLVMAGEVFSEEWRTLVGERMGTPDPLHNSTSIYGTADAGVLANETPLSVSIRRSLAERPGIARELFGESRLPTLLQYDPTSRYFEAVAGALLFTGDNGIPLIRYNILDKGGILGYDDMLAFLARTGFDPRAGLETREIRPLPFVWVFGRSNFTVSYFGANIYPENVTVGLEQPGIREWVTGKFVLQSKEDEDHDRFLWLVVELAPGEVESEERQEMVAESVVAQLMWLNSEFANYVPDEYRSPRVEFRPHGDPEYFPLGVKHRYTRK